jgi:uncharacterized protein (TIGR02453 family)
MAERDGFTAMVDEARTFFAGLDANNTKEWFEPRKDHYKAHIQKPAEFFRDEMAEQLSVLTGQTHTGKLHRVYRDTRFSKDKRPYNPHLHLYWQVAKSSESAPGWFFECSPQRLTINMGSPFLKAEGLAAYRKLVDEAGDALQDALDDAGVGFSHWGEQPLKRVPAPFDAAHPHAELLKRRSFVLDAPLGEKWRDNGQGLLGVLRGQCQRLLPVWSLLGAHLR